MPIQPPAEKTVTMVTDDFALGMRFTVHVVKLQRGGERCPVYKTGRGTYEDDQFDMLPDLMGPVEVAEAISYFKRRYNPGTIEFIVK